MSCEFNIAGLHLKSRHFQDEDGNVTPGLEMWVDGSEVIITTALAELVYAITSISRDAWGMEK